VSGSARLVEWEGLTLDECRARWRLPVVIALAETASTNDIARRMAEQGAPAGLLVMTEHQTAGRGRMMRTWTDVPGLSLLLSFVLRPAPAAGPAGIAAFAPGTAPLRVGVAVAGALRAVAVIDARLKWPNDVVADGGKLAGILCESASAGGETVIIAGIGINVLQRNDDWPAELRGHAVSLAQVASGAGPDRVAVMDAVTAALHPLFTQPLGPLSDAELRAHADLDALRGLDVVATGAGETRGTAVGISPDGALLLESAGGVHRITSGSVRVARPHTNHTARMRR
jgi:BirA family transcriptional regulator, biotin operon repressor / biotin---[acetyl-CoA-carboxylase] ligase